MVNFLKFLPAKIILEQLRQLHLQDADAKKEYKAIELGNHWTQETVTDLFQQLYSAMNITFKKIEELLEKFPLEININKQDTQVQVTLLHAAAGLGCFRLVDIFFKHGANPKLRNCFGQTPAERARLSARRNDVADYIDNLTGNYLAKVGQFRHAYREDFKIETNYPANQEPLKLR